MSSVLSRLTAGVVAVGSSEKRMKKITLGICAMDKKTKSKPMQEILKRLPDDVFDITIFGDDCIVNKSVEEWPVVEVLIAFYSTNYPTEKALEYVHLRKPFMLNDLGKDEILKDRRRIYEVLQQEGINVPVHVYCERDDPYKENVVEEFDEYIVVNGVQINKPLVEKPVDAEDHNIYIYYPISAGGGSKRLFRKVNDRSSEFYPRANELRRTGSYIYEEFIVTQGTDVKVYTVGPDYGHAEARKSPVVDGKVNRDAAGLEVRYPVILSVYEKGIVRKIVNAFGQTVCGFDILRVHGKSYCCDVNGFSFVKNSRKYYDDASQILTEIIMTAVRPAHSSQLSTRAPIVRSYNVYRDNSKDNPGGPGQSRRRSSAKKPEKGGSSSAPSHTLSNHGSDSDSSTQGGGRLIEDKLQEGGVGGGAKPSSIVESPNSQITTRSASPAVDILKPCADDSHTEELRCIIAVTRHGDRTPKEKMKVKVSFKKYLDYFHSYSKSSKKDLKVKSRTALVRFLNITREIIETPNLQQDDPDLYSKLHVIIDVLERWEISGICRKLQMKPLQWADGSGSEEAKERNKKEKKEKKEKHQQQQQQQQQQQLAEQKAKEMLDGPLDISTDTSVGGAGGDGLERMLSTDTCSIGSDPASPARGSIVPFGNDAAVTAGGSGTGRASSGDDDDASSNRNCDVSCDDGASVGNGIGAGGGSPLGKGESAFTQPASSSQQSSGSSDTGSGVSSPRVTNGKSARAKWEGLGIFNSLLDPVPLQRSSSTTSLDKEGKEPKATEILLILKWGGDLTPLGRAQAEGMGARFRQAMYPDNAGGGVLRLHATYRHDLKIKASDEGRVMKTAAAFAKGLLELEGQLTPIIASLVTVEAKNKSLLDYADNAVVKEDLDKCKKRLNEIQVESIDDAFIDKWAKDAPSSIRTALDSIKDPLRRLKRLHVLIGQLCAQLHRIVETEIVDHPYGDDVSTGEKEHNFESKPIERSNSEDLTKKLYLGETYTLMLDRWEKLNKDFFNPKTQMYDLSKVPDVYDMIRYDILHNSNSNLEGMRELYERIRSFENTLVPQEYGADKEEKSIIGGKVCGALLEKIKYDLIVSRSDTTHDMRYLLDHSHADDLEINSLGRAVRTRLYFTSESHMHTLLNVLRYVTTTGKDGKQIRAVTEEGIRIIEEAPELSYLTQIVIRLFEDRQDPEKFRCEISFTPGANNDIFTDRSPTVAAYKTINGNISCDDLLSCLSNAIVLGKELPPEEASAAQAASLDMSFADLHDLHLTDAPYSHGGEDSKPNFSKKDDVTARKGLVGNGDEEEDGTILIEKMPEAPLRHVPNNFEDDDFVSGEGGGGGRGRSPRKDAATSKWKLNVNELTSEERSQLPPIPAQQANKDKS